MTITLLQGDCLEIMPTLEAGSVDCVIADPPYGVEYEYSSYSDSKNNLSALVSAFIPMAKSISQRMAIFTGVKNIGLYSDADWFYSWIVPAGTGVSAFGFTCWTPIAFYGKDVFSGKGSRPDCYVDYKPKREGYDHPCEKPLSVMRWAMNRFSNPGDTILDPFAGSGTTGVAAIQTGRNAILIEKDPGYFAIMEKRIHDAQQQMRLPMEAG